MTVKRRPQDLTLRNLRAAKKRIATLEAGLKQTKEVIGLMARWIAETPAGGQALSAQNAAEIIEKLK